jgi:hypothetical protein
MLQLQPADIAATFTLIQIDARITNLITAINAAELALLDSLDDMQAKMRIQRQTLPDLQNALAIWIKAKRIITGDEDAEIELIAAAYLPDIEAV